MANEINSRDQNHVTVLSAITNDGSQEIRQLRVDPATGRLIVSAVVAGTNNGQLKVSAADTTYGYLSDKLVAGTNVTLTIVNPGANETYLIDVQGGGYDEVQEDGVALPARNILNFEHGFDVTDNGGNASTDVNIDESELDLGLMGGLLDLSTQVTGLLTATYIDESTLDLANIGGLLDLSTQVTGVLSSTNIDITNLESTLDLANIAGLLDLTTQVTGLLPVANIDVVALAGDATFLLNLIPNLNDNITVAVDGVTITGDGTSGNPLVAVGGGTGTSLGIAVNQVGHGLSVGDVIRSNGTDDEFTTAQADTTTNSEAVGIVTVVTDANNFEYVSSAVQLSGGFVPVGTPGDAVWLDPSVAGGITTTKPSTVGQVARGLGTIIASGATMYFDIAALAEEITLDGGTGNDKFVGVGSTENKQYFNIQIPYTSVDNAGAQVWVGVNSGVTTYSQWYTAGAGGSGAYLDTNFEGFPEFDSVSGTHQRAFDVQKEIIMETVAYIDTTENGDAFLGFNELGDATVPIIGANTLSLGFYHNGLGDFYVRSGTGAAFTDTSIASPTNAPHTYRIEYDPANTIARFYIDGVLVGTITTNLPTASALLIGVIMRNLNVGGNNSLEYATAPSFAVEI
jgi:hypothetical protein